MSLAMSLAWPPWRSTMWLLKVLSEIKKCKVKVGEEEALVGEFTMFEDKHVLKVGSYSLLKQWLKYRHFEI